MGILLGACVYFKVTFQNQKLNHIVYLSEKSLNMGIFKNYFSRFFSMNQPKKRIYDEKNWKKVPKNFT